MPADDRLISRLSELGCAEPNKPSIVMLSPTFIFVFTASSSLIDLVVVPDSTILRFDAETGENNIFLVWSIENRAVYNPLSW